MFSCKTRGMGSDKICGTDAFVSVLIPSIKEILTPFFIVSRYFKIQFHQQINAKIFHSVRKVLLTKAKFSIFFYFFESTILRISLDKTLNGRKFNSYWELSMKRLHCFITDYSKRIILFL